MNRANINIQSNIYVLEKELRNDWKFLRQVKGRTALEKLNKFNILPISGFSNVQKNIYSNQVKCVWADEGDFSFGIVKKGDQFRWECRCLKSDCHRFKKCREDLYRKSSIEVEKKYIEEIECIVEEEVAATLIVEPKVITEGEIREESIIKEEKIDITDTLKGQQEKESVIKISTEKFGYKENLSAEDSYFTERFEEAEQLNMLYKLTPIEVSHLTGRRNKILIVTKSKEDTIEAFKYLSISGIPQYILEEDQMEIKEQGIQWMPDEESRNSKQVHIVSLEEMARIEETYVGIIFTFEEPEVLERMDEACMQKLYNLCDETKQIYVSLLREHTHRERLKIQDHHINWRSFQAEEYQELLACIEQGDQISIKRMDNPELTCYICYMDMPIGEVQPNLLEEIKRLWERVYNKKLEDVGYLPIDFSGLFVRECVTCSDGNEAWNGIRLQGYIEIQSRYN